MATGGNLESLRRDNLSAVLRGIHENGPTSRAELTDVTGLNRSTVSALVKELDALGLVTESEPQATNRVGRPSPVVYPSRVPVAIAINPELDAVTVGVVGLHANVMHRVRHEVTRPQTPTETVAIVKHVVDEMSDALRGHRIMGVGLAVPGLVRSDGVVRWAPHLDWTDAPLTDLVAASLGHPVLAGNDATLGARAEWLFGVGRGFDDLVYLNGGASGIGGGVIAGGRVLTGRGGYAGEFGHNRPGSDRRDLVTSNGELEEEVSRARLLELVGMPAADDEQLEEALLTSSDPRTRRELARQRRVLSVALSNAVNVLNPALVVLGGFLGTLYQSGEEELAALVASQSVAASWTDTEIRRSALGTDLMMIGAAELVFGELVADPAL